MSDEYKIITGNCLDKLKELEDNSIDAIVTDPPYELGFMGKKWDNTGVAYNVELWEECLRVLKHGGHLLSFGGTRTYHRMTCAIEDAGFEIRDCVFWTYGSGFPKSLNIGKAYDKLKGNDREVIGSKKGQGNIPNDRGNWGLKPNEDVVVDKGTSEWEGWGTALKPAVEPICMARKPLSEKTIVENVIKWGVGGINIDESRIAPIGMTNDESKGRFPANLIWTHHPDCKETDELILNKGQKAGNRTRTFGSEDEVISGGEGSGGSMNEPDTYEKKWECVEGCPSKEFIETHGAGNTKPVKERDYEATSYKFGTHEHNPNYHKNSGGSTSRFFKSFSYEQEDLDYAPFYYCAKASKSERNKGLDGFEEKQRCFMSKESRISDCINPSKGMERFVSKMKNFHPTIKPLKLCEYLVKMVTPKGGVVLDPFMGSGTTGCACVKNGYKFVGIEMTEEYIPIAEARIKAHVPTQQKLEEI